MSKQPTIDELLEKLSSTFTEEDLNEIKLAYDYALENHTGMKRLTGDDYKHIQLMWP